MLMFFYAFACSITTDEKFYFVPVSQSTEVLEIDRLNFDLKLISTCIVYSHAVHLLLGQVEAEVFYF